MSSSIDTRNQDFPKQGPGQTDSEKLALTTGVEVEGHFAALINGKIDPDPGLQQMKVRVNSSIQESQDEHKAETLNAIDIMLGDIGYSKTGIRIRKVYHEHAISGDDISDGKLLGRRDENYIYEIYLEWAICMDGSGAWYPLSDKRPCPIGPPEYAWLPVEIKTRVYFDLDELSKDLRIILGNIIKNYRVSVKVGQGDSRAGVHVHIGNPNPGGFTLIHAKRLMTLVWIYEPAIMCLHATWKSNYIRFASLLRKHSHLAGLVRPPLSPPFYDPRFEGPKESSFDLNHGSLTNDYKADIPLLATPPTKIDKKAIDLIWGAKDMDSLAMLSASQFGERRPALSIHGLVAGGKNVVNETRKTPLRTIEFRHMQGSLNKDDIMNWVHVARKLVEICVNESSEEFKGRIKRCWNDLDNTDRQNFLKSIGLEHLNFKSQKLLNLETDTPSKNGPFDKIFAGQ